MDQLSHHYNHQSFTMGGAVLLLLSAFLALGMAAMLVDFPSSIQITWGYDRAKILAGGSILQLNLDRSSGSGFQTKNEYLFGRIDMQIKVVPGNSAGTVTAYYLSSQGSAHDEIDFEFLGNLSRDPYTLHTNIWTRGKGDREQQFKLWFDPRLDFHTYSILWNPLNVVWLVDNTPIRIFRNLEGHGIAFPKSQPMRLYSSLWDGDSWATRGGLVKTDWSAAPFTATYRNFNPDACVATLGGATSCPATKANWWSQTLDATGLQKLKSVRQNNMIYDYCVDSKRFPQGVPAECSFAV